MSPTTHPQRNSARFCPATTVQDADAHDADALIIALQSRRFVIVYLDDSGQATSPKMRPVDPLCKPLRDLTPGERVYYKGRIDRVTAISPF